MAIKKTKAKGKKESSKKATTKSRKPRQDTTPPKPRKHVDPVEVRRKMSDVVGPAAPRIIRAIVNEAVKGQLAHAKYALESGGIFPAAESDPMHPEEDSLAMTLLKRLGLQEKPVVGLEESQVSVPNSNRTQTDSNTQVVEKVSVEEKCTITLSEQQALPDNTVE